MASGAKKYVARYISSVYGKNPKLPWTIIFAKLQTFTQAVSQDEVVYLPKAQQSRM